MTYYEINEDQRKHSGVGTQVETTVSAFVLEADRIAGMNGSVMKVVSTKHAGLCVYNEYQMRVARDEIIEEIYSTENGFNFRRAA